MVGPIAGANVADSANIASPIGCFDARQHGQRDGERQRDQHAAEEALHRAQHDHLLAGCCANAQATDITRNITVFASR